MSWTVLLTRSAERDLRRLDPPVAKRILDSVARYAETGQGDIRRVFDSNERWRLRVGDWRVLFEREVRTHTLVILHIRPRGEAYR